MDVYGEDFDRVLRVRPAPTATSCSSASTAPPPHRLGTELSTRPRATVGCVRAMKIEDYGLIGDLQTAALVGRDGSIDWLCLPRFDSGACFAALLGDESHGRWLIAPAARCARPRGATAPDTLVLETDFETADGHRARDRLHAAARAGRRSHADRRRPARPRPDAHGARARASTTARSCRWWSRVDGARASPGPTRSHLSTPVELHGRGPTTVAEFTVPRARASAFVMTLAPVARGAAAADDAEAALARTEAWWREWSDRCTYDGRWREAVLTLADHAQGAHLRADRRNRRRADDVAARGPRRRAQLGLPLLLAARRDAHAARAARRRLHRRGATPGGTGCCAPSPAIRPDVQIMYGLAGERRLHGDRARLAARVRGLAPGAHRQRGGRAVPARRVRRDHRTRCTSARRRRASVRRRSAWDAAAATCSSSSRRSGASPTTASGRCAGRGGTSRTRRSWRGWPSTAR